MNTPEYNGNNLVAVLGINGVGKTSIIQHALMLAPEGSVAFNAAELMLDYLGLTSRKELEAVPPIEKERARIDSVMRMVGANTHRPVVFLDTHMKIWVGTGADRTSHLTWCREFNPLLHKAIFIDSDPADIKARRLRRPHNSRTLDHDAIREDQEEERRLFESHLARNVPVAYISNQEGQLEDAVRLLVSEVSLQPRRLNLPEIPVKIIR